MSIKTSNWLFGIIMILITVVSILFASCKKQTDEPLTISDIDGNVYHSVIVGNQEWMVENLKVTHFNDGTVIPLVEDQKIWNSLPSISSPGYCYYDNNMSNEKTYGCLYNYYSINTGKLAPKGWHVANNNDWSGLMDYLGGLDIAGGKIKSTGTTYWKTPNDGATNVSGLSVLPAGYRDSEKFTGLGETTSIASADLYDENMVIAISTYSYQKRSNYGGGGLSFGLSVRCVKDKP
jgi:uncharacterized protein (TIGR02145 family)